MVVEGLTPILNVSNIEESFAWFAKLGWAKAWDWGSPPAFGCVRSGKCEIFLCQSAQGGRGNGGVKMTFGPDGDETKACGCRSGSMMSMQSIGSVSPRGWTWPGRRRTCRGTSARCTFGTPTGTSSGSAGESTKSRWRAWQVRTGCFDFQTRSGGIRPSTSGWRSGRQSSVPSPVPGFSGCGRVVATCER